MLANNYKKIRILLNFYICNIYILIITSKSLIFSLHYVNLNDIYCVVENLTTLYPSHFLSDDDPLSKYCEVYSLNRLLAIIE